MVKGSRQRQKRAAEEKKKMLGEIIAAGCLRVGK